MLLIEVVEIDTLKEELNAKHIIQMEPEGRQFRSYWLISKRSNTPNRNPITVLLLGELTASASTVEFLDPREVRWRARPLGRTPISQ